MSLSRKYGKVFLLLCILVYFIALSSLLYQQSFHIYQDVSSKAQIVISGPFNVNRLASINQSTYAISSTCGPTLSSKVQINDTLAPLRRWNKSRALVYLHIGKNGGTSFDVTMAPIIRKIHGNYIGNRHFDWSYIDTLKTPDVLILLREPVSRAVSHFYFSKRLYFSKILGKLTLKDYLHNPQIMLETRDIWQDGQAAVSWLTGTHIARWVGIKPKQVADREIRSLDRAKMCREAAAKLRQTLWFGFLSDQNKSFEMLQWQLGYTKTIKLSKSNSNSHPDVTQEEELILRSLMPLDLWFYKYAEMLFEARWRQYKTGVYREPQLPPLPDINCKSTRFVLACNRGSPLGPLYHVWNKTKEINNQQMKLLPKGEWT